MKNILIVIHIIAVTLLTNTVAAADVEFKISGIKSDDGKLYVQLFKGEQNYNSSTVESASIVKAKKGELIVLFNNIEPGDYALRFFHDENNNATLETNLFGIPVEGYGFSNNAKPNFGPVNYSEMKFLVSSNSDKVHNHSTAIY